MAKKELAFEASVDIGNGAKSIQTLKEEYKAAQQELNGLEVGTKAYVKQLEKLGQIKDNIGDLNAEIAAFNPEGKVQAFSNVVGGLASGFSAAQGAMALFGAEGEDLQRTLVKVQAGMAFAEGIKGLAGLKDGFVVLNNVLKENLILLIASIIVGIGTALFALKDKIKPVADAFEFLGDVIDTVIEGAKQFLDYIGLTNFALDKQRDTILKNNEQIKKSVESRYDAEIQAAKRAGKETEGLEIQKLKAITEANESTIRTLKAKGKERTDEEEKQLDELLAANKGYYQDILNLADAAADRRGDEQQKQRDEYQKHLDELKAKNFAYAEARADAINKEADAYDAMIKKQKEQQKAAKEQGIKDAEELANKMLEENQREYLAGLELKALQNENDIAAQVEFLDAKMAIELENKELTESEKALIEEKYRQQKEDLERQHNEAMIQQSIEGATTIANSLQSLSDAVFTIKMQNLEKGSAAELKAAKQQFKINKALAITQATISTIQGVINALSAQVAFPEPYATIYRVASAAAVGIAGAANIAKISAQQFNAGGGGGGGGNVGAAGGGVNVAPPSTGSTLLNADGSIKKQQGAGQQTVKAIVTETDITQTQKRVNSIEETSKIK